MRLEDPKADLPAPSALVSEVTLPQAPPAVTSDPLRKTKKVTNAKTKKVTSDSPGKSNTKKVLKFKAKPESLGTQPPETQVTHGGIKWEIAECGCWLPKEKGYEWRPFENGHRLLLVIGYGISKNGKRTKRRDQFRYFTHSALKEFVRREYGIQIQPAAKA
jgi:hypothetical protein